MRHTKMASITSLPRNLLDEISFLVETCELTSRAVEARAAKPPPAADGRRDVAALSMTCTALKDCGWFLQAAALEDLPTLRPRYEELLARRGRLLIAFAHISEPWPFYAAVSYTHLTLPTKA